MYKDTKNWRDRTKGYLVDGFGRKCACCGEESPYNIIYDFHHLDPNEKEFTISAIKCKAWDTLVTEAKKCIMLCCKCHRLYHAGVVDIPADAPEFDVALTGYVKRTKKEIEYDICPVCKNQKKTKNTVCSLSCAGRMITKVDWDIYDLNVMYKLIGSYEGIGRELGVSGAAVKKRMKKQNALVSAQASNLLKR